MSAAAIASPPVPTRIYLVRHGETHWNARGLHQGTADVSLSARGVAQVGALAARLRQVAFDAAYSSALQRARDTAACILAGRDVTLATDPALGELAYGAWQGKSRDAWQRDDPAVVARWDAAPWSVTFPGGESLDDVHRRVVPAWERIVAAHRGQCVLVSAHGHVNRVLLIHALRLPRDGFWTIAQPNAGCCRFEYAAPGTAPGTAPTLVLVDP